MHEVIVFTATFSDQSREIRVVVDVLANLAPQSIEGSTKLSFYGGFLGRKGYLRNRSSEVDSTQMWRFCNGIPENGTIGGDKIDHSFWHTRFPHDLINRPIG
jgi:hypothetical protein